jgi:hypothetical protein
VSGTFRERVNVASEKADFIADRIAAGVPAPEREMRRLAQYLRETAAAMSAGAKKPRPSMANPAAGGQPPVAETGLRPQRPAFTG